MKAFLSWLIKKHLLIVRPQMELQKKKKSVLQLEFFFKFSHITNPTESTLLELEMLFDISPFLIQKKKRRKLSLGKRKKGFSVSVHVDVLSRWQLQSNISQAIQSQQLCQPTSAPFLSL